MCSAVFRRPLLLLALALLAVAGVATVLRVRRARAPRVRNVVLLLVDTLRADHLSVYGYGRDTSPNLERLAKSAVVFEHVRSQAPCTFPSANSILTSQPPTRFLGQPDGHFGIPEGVPSIAEILAERGYVSRAVSASAIVRATPSDFNRVGGFQRGFATFDEHCVGQAADCVNARTFALWPSKDAPWLLYVHYMDPHGPYRPPLTHKWKFARKAFPNALIGRADPVEIDSIRVLRAPPGVAPLRPEELQHLIDLYDDEIASWDEELGRMFEHLASEGNLGDTMVVLLADHGEAFLEHGVLNHCRSLYENETRTPLALWIPGVAGRRVSTPVENLDVVPTVLDYLGIEAPGLAGRSLRALAEGRAPDDAPRYVHAVHHGLRSIDDGRWKEIRDVVTGRREIYDLQADPGETTDLAGTVDASLSRRLGDDLSSWIRASEGENSAQNAERGAQAIENLKALGYLQ